jgi:hypothetical protein
VPSLQKTEITKLAMREREMEERGHKDQRTFFDYIKLSSDEIADKIMEKLRQSENIGNERVF